MKLSTILLVAAGLSLAFGLWTLYNVLHDLSPNPLLAMFTAGLNIGMAGMNLANATHARSQEVQQNP